MEFKIRKDRGLGGTGILQQPKLKNREGREADASACSVSLQQPGQLDSSAPCPARPRVKVRRG